jgi:uncharacterized membrane protein YoaK (UPF0700 family)
VFVAVAVVLAIVGGGAPPTGYRYVLIAALGVAMGIQNAAARAIAVPDLTTTVLTLTITGVAADSALAVIIAGPVVSRLLGRADPAWVSPVLRN